MKLSQIEAEVKTVVGSDSVFLVKSLKSERVFRVTGKSPSGQKYVIVNVADDTKEYLVSGSEERYELYDDGTLALLRRKTEINKALDVLETKRFAIEDEMETLENELMSIAEKV